MYKANDLENGKWAASPELINLKVTHIQKKENQTQKKWVSDYCQQSVRK